MITVISCSVRPERSLSFRQNVAATIGAPHEVITFDNREARLGLCAVYNHCAPQATYDALCFAHEDIQFNTVGWAPPILDFMQSTDCGVIGFAGATAKTKHPSGWGSLSRFSRLNYVQHFKDRPARRCYKNPGNERFAQALVLDGFCLLVKKSVWREFPFDERTFDRHHVYDLDFTMQVAQRYKNYVCYTAEIEHFSPGAYDESWLEYTRRFHAKWDAKLPCYLSPAPSSVAQANEHRASRGFVRTILRNNLAAPKDARRLVLAHLRGRPWRDWKLVMDYLSYQRRRRAAERPEPPRRAL